MKTDVSISTPRKLIKSFFLSFFKNSHMHVKISAKGREMLNDRELASKLVETVMNHKTELEKGERVRINGGDLGVKLVTTLKESTHK